MTTIRIRVERGQVRSVEDIPTDVVLEVIDYDVQKYRELELSHDADGRLCDIRQWRAPE